MNHYAPISKKLYFCVFKVQAVVRVLFFDVMIILLKAYKIIPTFRQYTTTLDWRWWTLYRMCNLQSSWNVVASYFYTKRQYSINLISNVVSSSSVVNMTLILRTYHWTPGCWTLVVLKHLLSISYTPSGRRGCYNMISSNIQCTERIILSWMEMWLNLRVYNPWNETLRQKKTWTGF